MRQSVFGAILLSVGVWLTIDAQMGRQVTAQATYTPGQVTYDIVYVRQPRYGDQTNTIWPEVFHPARIDPGADLMLRHPNGSEEVLFAGGHGAVTDPFLSFDARWVYFSYFPDVRTASLNYQRNDLPRMGADIFKLNLQTRVVQQLTFGEFTPNTGAGRWDESNPLNPPSTFNSLGYGILNLGPCPLPGGKLVFTSNRNAFEPTKGYTSPTLQLFVMDEDGSNVTPIAPMTIGSALHPTVLRDGRVMFSSYESQGLRDSRVWGIWAINPDGRNWRPLVSSFKAASAFHFMTQVSSGDLVVEHYYNLNNNGFGAFLRVPLAPTNGTPAFHNAFPNQNPSIVSDVTWHFRMPFTPIGSSSLTPFTHGDDNAATLGKVTHPSAAPNNDLLLVWSKGPANDLERPSSTPRYDAGLYLIPGGSTPTHPNQMVLIKNDPNFNEAWPRAVVPYSAVHGQAEPAVLPWLPNDGTVDAALPAGTPFGLVGTSSFYKRESFPGTGAASYHGLDVFNTSENDHSSNWFWQGADAGRYANSDIWAVRVLAMEPNTHRSYGPNNGQHYYNFANERLRILGEVPLRKADSGGNPVLDPEGNPDTSVLMKLPADTPFTFQTIDRNGMVLNMAQTWHQVRPGEKRVDCGGCHAHSQQPLAFESTAASRPGYQVYDLSKVTPLLTRTNGQPALRVVNASVVDVEFYRDIRPILQRSCTPCHTQSNPSPPGNLVLDDYALSQIPDTQFRQGSNMAPGDYVRLAGDQAARWGHKPVIPAAVWRQTNASRYVRMFQSRRSLLVWKIFGQRLDGWTNADHPTESVPGNAATLPAGADRNLADLDFVGSIMPPVGSGVAPLSDDEKMTIARWIDLGAPIDTGAGTANAPYGWFLDDLRPTLTVSAPRPGFNVTPPTAIRFGMADANSGIDLATLSVKATFVVAGRAAGAELRDLAQSAGDGIYQIPIAAQAHPRATVTVQVADRRGNITRVAQTFTTAGTDGDADGLPDVWETTYGLNPGAGGGADGSGGDPDGDGATNAEEYARGTHPRGFHTRYLAEGATGTFFKTRLALLNPGTTTATVLVRFLQPTAGAASQVLTLPSRRRATIDAGSVAGLSQAEFSTIVESDQLLAVDRTMSWDAGTYGSHAEAGSLSPAASWYLAEGSTAAGFGLFYLLQNPHPTQTSQVRVTFLLPGGGTVVKSYAVAPNARHTIWANQINEIASTDVSAVVETTNAVPIIVERAMYLSRGSQTFTAGHASAGVTTPRLEWFLAEGATGPFFDEFVLLANPSSSAATVLATYYLPDGSTLTKSYTLPARSRTTVWLDEESFAGRGKALANTAVSTRVSSQNAVPIVVERAMWWPGGAATWVEAHNSAGAVETGPRWALAEGEVGGSSAAETFVLLANTSASAASVAITLLFEDGATASKNVTVAGQSRFNVWVKNEFPQQFQQTASRRFGVLIEGSAGTPPQLVVERAMYSNAGGETWAAGTNALGMKLP